MTGRVKGILLLETCLRWRSEKWSGVTDKRRARQHSLREEGEKRAGIRIRFLLLQGLDWLRSQYIRDQVKEEHLLLSFSFSSPLTGQDWSYTFSCCFPLASLFAESSDDARTCSSLLGLFGQESTLHSLRLPVLLSSSNDCSLLTPQTSFSSRFPSWH